MLADGIALYLDALGLVSYDGAGVSGDTFINVLPSQPDQVITITPYGGDEPQAKLGYDNPRIQIRARSSRDPRPAYNRLKAIFNALQDLKGVTLPNGIYLVGCWAMQSDPQFIGVDANWRHEYVQNYRFHVRNQTDNRE